MKIVILWYVGEDVPVSREFTDQAAAFRYMEELVRDGIEFSISYE